MKTLLSLLFQPLKWIANRKTSGMIFRAFEKVPFLTILLAFLIATLVLLIHYGVI
jgi:hypothetical protein